MAENVWPIIPSFLSLRKDKTEEDANFNVDGVYFVDYLRGFIADLSHDKHIQNALSLFQFVPKDFVPLDSNADIALEGIPTESGASSIFANEPVYDSIQDVLGDRRIIRIDSGTYVNNGCLCDCFRRCERLEDAGFHGTNKDFCYRQDSLVGIFAHKDLKSLSPLEDNYCVVLQEIVKNINQTLDQGIEVQIERVERRNTHRCYLHYTCPQSKYEEHIFPIYARGKIVACLMLGQMARSSFCHEISFVKYKDQFKDIWDKLSSKHFSVLTEEEWKEKERTIIDRIEVFEQRLEDRLNHRNFRYLNTEFDKIEDSFQKALKGIDVKVPYFSFDTFFGILSSAFTRILREFDPDNSGFIRMFALPLDTESKRLIPIGWSGANARDYQTIVSDFFFLLKKDKSSGEYISSEPNARIQKEITTRDIIKPFSLVGKNVSFIIWKQHPLYLTSDLQKETFLAYKKCLISFYKLAMQCYAYIRGARLEFVLDTTIRATTHESAHFIHPALDVVENRLSVIPSIMVRPEYHQEYKEYCTRYNNQKEDILNALKLLDYINARPSMIFRPLKLRKENTMLFPLLFRMVKMMKDRADNNDMYIDYKQNSAFVSATIDEIYFSHAIFNLLDNAVKYAYDGSRIHVNMKVDNNQQCVIIEVESYGIQILEGERIYDLFFRGETVSKSNLSGMGIGMFLVRKICRAHGGDITHSSTLISEMNVPVLFALSRKRSIASKLSEDERDSCIKEYTRLSSMEEIIVETSSFVKYPFVFKSRVFQPTYKNVFSIKLPLV